MNAEIMTKLQSHRGYQGWRIRPYPPNTALWLAEPTPFLGAGIGKAGERCGTQNGATIERS